MSRLICRLFWHDWRPAGWLYRSCRRCHMVERINRGDNT